MKRTPIRKDYGRPIDCATDATTYPLLCALLTAGTVRLDGSTYVGEASDGVHVDLGSVGYEKILEHYLTTHPAPSDW